jgi:hypothetical protein
LQYRHPKTPNRNNQTIPNSSRRKGHDFEREIARQAEDAGVPATRAWNSQGTSIGEVEECDLRLDETVRVSAKRRKNHAQYLHPPDGTEAVILREDYSDALAVVPLDLFLDLLRSV